MAPEHTTHYEGVSVDGNSRPQFGHNFNTTLEALNERGSQVASQAGQQTIHGGQHNYFGDRSPHPTAAARPSRCVSVPFATVPTYTERPHLTEELGTKLGKRHGSAGLAHAVTVIGLGGTGKTQLVLRYIEEHEEEYDPILWLDVRSAETALSSYERCCRTLGLPVEAPIRDEALQDMPAVQAVLSWLRSRDEDKKWLSVVDNADDLSWDVSGIMPQGKAGTVIVTSQDAQASRLLGGRIPTVKVDAMEAEEAVRLVSNYFDESVYYDDACRILVKEITQCLDRLALPMDLAGARVRADMEYGNDLITALRQYLEDYKRRQDELLRDEEFASTSTYKKTAWTAWKTSLASLRKLEDNRTDVHPTRLLSFLTFLDRNNIQDTLFCMASVGLEEARRNLYITLPSWMQGLLSKDADGQWNDSSYQASIKLLLRYGLVRPVIGKWKGVTMHSLVKWRAGVAIDRDEYWRWYIIFLTAVCVHASDTSGERHFRRQIILHLPSANQLLQFHLGSDEDEQLCWICEIFGDFFREEGMFKEAQLLLERAAGMRASVNGREHPKTLSTMADLAVTYSQQGFWTRATELSLKVIESRKKILGDKHPATLTSMHLLAVNWSNEGRWTDAVKLFKVILKARREVLGQDDPDILRSMSNLAMTISEQGRWKEAEKLEVAVLEAKTKVLGKEHPETLGSMDNLAMTISKQGRWKEAEELEVAVLEAMTKVLGKEHPETLGSMDNLAMTISKQGRWKEAEELEVAVLEAMTKVLGKEHPETLGAMGNLAVTISKQGRWKEAEKLEVAVLEAKTNVLGEEHPDTLGALANLSTTYRNQGRLKQAEELDLKVLEARSRVLGDEHPDKLTAMANLAYTKRDLGQNDTTTELMTPYATASSRVSGSGIVASLGRRLSCLRKLSRRSGVEVKRN